MTRIVETSAGYDVVADDGAVVSTHPTVRAALDVARPMVGAALHEPHLRENGEPIGKFTWLDACSIEEPSQDGYFDRAAIEEMVTSLNAAAMPIPIDGGASSGLSPSPVHGTRNDTSTPANGWGHSGVLVEMSDGPHLFMWSELWPSVAADVERGRIAYGSVLAMTPDRADDGAYRGCRLVGHALTNVPVIRTLTPSTAVRAYAAAVRSIPMTTKKTEPKTDDVAAKADAVPPVAPKADPPSAAPAAPSPEEDKDAVIAALRSELEAAKAQIEALMAEAAASMPSEEERVAAALKSAEGIVDAAVRAGTVAPSARAKWVDVVVKSGEQVFKDLTRGMRARPVERQVKGPEAAPAARLDPKDPTVMAMRAANISDATIAKNLIERDARKEN